MQLVVNEKLAKSRLRLGTILHFIGLAVLAVGLYVSLQARDPSDTLLVVLPWVAILAFFIPNQLGKRYLQRYGPRNRQDAALAQAAKGLDNRFSLLAFAEPGLPDYLLVGPAGVHVLVARAHNGTLVCRANGWERNGASGITRLMSSLWGTPFGNPSRDAQDGVALVSKALTTRLGDGAKDIPVTGLVVLTNSQAQVQSEGCSVQIATTKNLKTQVRGGKGGLAAAQIARVREALGAEIAR